MVEDNNSSGKIEDIKRRLYEREDTITNRRKEGVLHQINHKVDSIWKEELTIEDDLYNLKMKKPPTSIFKKFFIVAIIFFFGASIFALYTFYNRDTSVSNDKIDITILGNSFTKGGEELPLQIEITNYNNASLELVNLIVEYPKGAEDKITDVIRLPRDIIGTIKPGESVIRNIKVTLFGYEKSIRNIKINLEYHPEGSNATFTKEKEHSVTISSAPLSLLVDAPTTTSTDQSITLIITAVLNTSLPQDATILQVSYPNNFIFDSSNPLPSIGNSTWDISSITKTNSISIEIKGRLVGQDGDKQSFRIYAGNTSSINPSLIDVIYNSFLQTITITKPFLEVYISVNSGQGSSTVSSGEIVNIQIPWSNNSLKKIMDAQIIAKISGNVFDKNTVQTSQGFYDSSNNQIIWDKNTIASLANINPGEKGVVDFSLTIPSLISLYKGIKEPQLLIEVSIRGRQPEYGTSFSDIDSFIKKVIKVSSNFQIISSANFSSGFLPPKAEKETRYKVTWTLSNSVNSISQAQARSILPIYVNWVGIVSGEREKISYNEITREIIWDIGSIPPTNGFDSNREVSFIISLKPSLSQVGTAPILMKEVYLSGQDMFANVLIKSKYNSIKTLLFNDPNFEYGYEKVIE